MSRSNDSSNGEGNRPDRDSLMALQALLTIRTESMADSDSQSPSPPASSEQTFTTGTNSNGSSPDPNQAKAAPDKVSEAHVWNVASRPAASEIVVKPAAAAVRPPQQHHPVAHYGTQYVLPSRAPVGYSNHPYDQHGFHGPTQAQASGFAGYQFFVPQGNGTGSAPVLHAPNPAAATIMVPAAAPQGQETAKASPARSGGQKRKKASPSPKSPSPKSSQESSTQHTEELSAAEKQVRKEEIEAALRSKPQRGRKRENLSAEERLELTRTRNREHAKSTRIRKKARYQELLDKEQEYEELQKLQNLVVQRRNCFLEFISAWTRMLQTSHHSSAFAASQDGIARAAGASRANDDATLHRDNRVVSFADGLSTAGEPNGLKPAAQDLSSMASNVEFSASTFETREQSHMLEGLVENVETFRFEHMGASPLDPNQVTEGSSTRAVLALKHADRDLVSSIAEQYGQGIVPSLTYRVKNPNESVAIGPEGVGYAEVDITMRGTDQVERAVKSLIFKLRYGSGSSKLSSVEWSDIEFSGPAVAAAAAPVANQGDCPSSSSGESSLGCQKSYPSVVSLDQGTTFQGPSSSGESSGEQAPRKTSEDGSGPGIVI